jgi:hypothetical protein
MLAPDWRAIKWRPAPALLAGSCEHIAPRLFRHARPFVGARWRQCHPFLLDPASAGRERLAKPGRHQLFDAPRRQFHKQAPMRQGSEDLAVRLQRVRSETAAVRGVERCCATMR